MTFDDLPTDAKMMSAYAVRIGLFVDEDSYLKEYARGAPAGFVAKPKSERERLDFAARMVAAKGRWK